MSYATGHNSFTSQYLLNIYIYCRFCRLCLINVRKKEAIVKCVLYQALSNNGATAWLISLPRWVLYVFSDLNSDTLTMTALQNNDVITWGYFST
jgi:hypothetical protein